MSDDTPNTGGFDADGIARSPTDAQLQLAHSILANLRQPVIVLGPGMSVEAVNPAFCDCFDVAPEACIRESLFDLGNGQWDIPELRDLLDDVEQRDGKVTGFRVDHTFEKIGRRVMIFDASRIQVGGRKRPRILATISDIAEQERLRWELEGQKEYAEMIVDAVRDPLLVMDWDLRVKTANERFYNAFDVDPDETEGRLVVELGNGQWDIPALRKLLEDVLPNDNAFDDYEVEHDFERIGHRIMLLNARRLNHHQLILLAIEDVTERRRSEGQQKVLMGELQHRVKNILMNVRALARQTRRNSTDLTEFAERFDGRLDSLSRTQDLLLKSSGDVVPLDELIRLELSARGADEDERFVMQGPVVRLAARAAQPMAMTIHELATNAAKYGALSQPEGELRVTWRIERQGDVRHLHLEWRERGVPIAAPPQRRGFGSQVIQTSLPYLFGGSCTLDLAPDGAVCVLDMPLPVQ